MGMKASTEYEIQGELYKRLRVLGKGAYGKVYAMEHVASGHIRVIKELLKGQIVAEGETSIEGNLNERRMLAELLTCPYVCQAYAANQDKKYLYIMLEYCAGGELAYHLKMRSKFSESDVKMYLAECLVGLDELHSVYHIVHRDLKPENILLTEKGHIRLIDFNCAIKANNDQNFFLNEDKSIAGTLPYIAPEVLRGESFGAEVDCWSLGVLVFELLTGRKPFGSYFKRKEQLKAIRKTSMSNQLDKEEAEGLECSEEMRALLCGLCEMDPSKRLSAAKAKQMDLFEGVDWDLVREERIVQVPFKPDANKVNFAADANAADALGMDRPKGTAKVLEEHQSRFAEWTWFRENQNLPPPISSERKAKADAKARKIAASRDKALKVATGSGQSLKKIAAGEQ